jgi:hypothetical protein
MKKYMIKYSPVNDDSAVERIEFTKDDKTITLVNRFDTYAVYIEDEDDDFDMTSYDPEAGARMIFVSEEEGERIEFSVEGDISDRQKAKIIAAFQESYESGPEELGWEWSDRELWFYGPIVREEE